MINKGNSSLKELTINKSNCFINLKINREYEEVITPLVNSIMKQRFYLDEDKREAWLMSFFKKNKKITFCLKLIIIFISINFLFFIFCER
jgi:hypothetical protein